MKILLITDIEGVNGILNFSEYCLVNGKHYDTGCRLLTGETNAVVEGFFRAAPGAEIVVWDGHGEGAIDVEMLDDRVYLQQGTADWPDFGDYAAIAFVGQHAKAGTPGGQLAHTQTGDAIDFRINGTSLGEFGQQAWAAAERGIPVIFASGDVALTLEAQKVSPGIVTVAVKKGIGTPAGKDTPCDNVGKVSRPAIHFPRGKVLAELTEKAAEAMKKFVTSPDTFKTPIPSGPYTAEAEYRAISSRLSKIFGDLPARSIHTRPCRSIREAIREFYSEVEWIKPDGDRVKAL